jgi:hypothetical protein
MGKAMTADSNRSPAAKVMDEAIDLAIEGRSPYPERASCGGRRRRMPMSMFNP